MNDNEAYKLMGELLGRLKAIESNLKDANIKSSESRKAMLKSLNEIHNEAAETRHRLLSLETIVDEDVKPMIKNVNDWRSRTLGVLFILGIMGAIMFTLLTSLKDFLVHTWEYFSSK